MERTPRKSRALIITIVIIVILSIMAYLMFISKSGIFSPKDSNDQGKGFSSLLNSLRPGGLSTTQDGTAGNGQANTNTGGNTDDSNNNNSNNNNSNSSQVSNSTNTDSQNQGYPANTIFPNFNPLPNPWGGSGGGGGGSGGGGGGSGGGGGGSGGGGGGSCRDASGNPIQCNLLQCGDGIDNDRDSLIDAADPGCHSDLDANNPTSYNKNLNNESNVKVTLPQCSDSIDNDSDSFVDKADAGCHSDFNASNNATYNKNLNNESNVKVTLPQCSDSIDNDKDNLIDKADPGCHSDFNASNNATYDGKLNNESLTKETLPQCGDKKDNDSDGLVDERDPSCHTDFDKTNSLSYDSKIDDESKVREILTECNDNGDNDSDGLVDERDPSCHTDYNASNNLSYEKSLNNESKVGIVGTLEAGGMCPDDPLVFTEEEKAQLSLLLKQYYLLAPTLRIEDDITLLDYDNQTNEELVKQATTLISDCKAQKANPAYTGPREIKDNPYYQNANTAVVNVGVNSGGGASASGGSGGASGPVFPLCNPGYVTVAGQTYQFMGIVGPMNQCTVQVGNPGNTNTNGPTVICQSNYITVGGQTYNTDGSGNVTACNLNQTTSVTANGIFGPEYIKGYGLWEMLFNIW